MNRYDHHFRQLPQHVQQIPTQKVGFARGALFERRAEGFGPVDDETIVRQFDLAGMSEFWEIELSEPMACVDFTRSLASHFFVIEDGPDLTEAERKKLGPAAERVVDSFKAGIRQALRAARSYDEPWFTVIPDPPPRSKLDAKAWMGFLPIDTVFVPADPPADGIDLSKLRVQPRDAVKWMLASAQRRHLVPPSLAAVLRPPETSSARTTAPAAEQVELAKSGAPGRPTSMHLVELEMTRRAEAGEQQNTMLAEAKALVVWLATEHPAMPRLTPKAIQNALGSKFRQSRT